MTLQEINRQIRNLEAMRRRLVRGSLEAFRLYNEADAKYRAATHGFESEARAEMLESARRRWGQ